LLTGAYAEEHSWLTQFCVEIVFLLYSNVRKVALSEKVGRCCTSLDLLESGLAEVSDENVSEVSDKP